MRDVRADGSFATRVAGVLMGVAGWLVWAGTPLRPAQCAAAEAGAAESNLEQELAKVERACSRAGLTAEETKVALALGRRVKADRKELFKLQARGKLSDAESRVVEKLIREVGHPLERELSQLRAIADEAKLTADERTAAEKLALSEGLDNQAILRRYDSGQLSAVEKAALDKVLALKGRPEPPQPAANAGQRNQTDGFRQVAKLAGLTAAEADALLEAVKQGGSEERGLLDAKRAGKLSDAAAAGLKKLEGLFGKLEDFVASPHKKEIGQLLELSAKAGLTADETRSILKVAVAAKFDLDTAKQMKASGRLSEAEARAVDKLLSIVNR